MMLGERRGGEKGESSPNDVSIVQFPRFEVLFELIEDLVGGRIVFGDGGEIGQNDGYFFIVSFESLPSGFGELP